MDRFEGFALNCLILLLVVVLMLNLTGYGGGKTIVFWNRNSSTHLFQGDTIYCAEKDAMEIVGANLSGMIVCFQSLSSLRFLL